MAVPEQVPHPLELDERNEGFSGPFEIGIEDLLTLFPIIERGTVTPEVPLRLANGSVSHLELLVLSAITQAVQPERVLEIGTFQGLTAVNIARHMPVDGELTTVDLPPEGSPNLPSDDWNARYYPQRSIGPVFLDSEVPPTVRQVKGDTAELSEDDLGSGFDLVFIDGNHSDAYIRNDTELALSLASERAILIWHDYGKVRHWPAITSYLYSLARDKRLYPLYWLRNEDGELDTSLVMHVLGASMRG